MKILSKVKSLAKRCKVGVVAAAVAVSSALVSVCASAATTEASGSDMTTLLSNAGEQLQKSFSDLVMTLIPVILGIMGTALVIFGIFALIKLGKRIFGKVAG